MEENEAGLPPTILAEDLSMHYNTLKKYINVLEELGLIEAIADNNKTIYKLKISEYHKILDLLNDLRLGAPPAEHKISTETEQPTEQEGILEKASGTIEGAAYEISMDANICIAHNDIIEGKVFQCPNCQANYCENCANDFIIQGKNCAGCNTHLKQLIPVQSTKPKPICAIHKKIIEKNGYLCPNCQETYCDECCTDLILNQGKCSKCGNPIKTLLPLS
jgi:hypothetical protein